MSTQFIKDISARRRWRMAGLLALILLAALIVLLNAPGIQAGDPQQAATKAELMSECRLLDDAQARNLMSGMFETKLLLACGRSGELGQVQNPASPDTLLLGPDVLVNDPTTDSGSSRTQSETSLAINQNNGTICSGYNDSYHGVTQGQGYTGFSSSTDGGASFTDHGPIGAVSFGDPSVIWRKSDGKFYIATIHSSGMGLWRSDTDCATFTFVGNPHIGSGDDKELLAVDNNPASPYYGRIYMAWTDFNAGARIFVTYSDNTTTWSTPVAVSAVGVDVQGAWPTVAPNGDVYVAWVRWNPYSTGPIDIEVVRSTNGGTSFTQVANPLTGGINPREAAATASCGRPALKGNIRYLPSPQIAVSPNGDLHVVYVYDPDGLNVGDVINTYYRRSTDSGATWGPEIQLNDDGTLTDQFFPTVSVGPSGRVVATWYDRRLDVANNTLFDYYMRVSSDGGSTWQASERVSDVSSPVVLDPNLATCYHGDYDQQAQDATGAYIQWSDDRTVVLSDPNVWFDAKTFASDFTLDVSPASLEVCVPANAVFNVTVGQVLGFTDPVTLSASGQPNPPNSATFNPGVVVPPGGSTLTIGTTGAAPGSYMIDVVGVAPTSTHTTTVQLNLFDAVATVNLVSPPNGAIDVPLQPTLTWNGTGNSYFVEVATDAAFTNVIDSAIVNGTSYMVGINLSGNVTYYWRVTADNACGNSTSPVWHFTTLDLQCSSPNLAIPDNNPAGVTNDLVIANGGTIDDLNVSVGMTHSWVGDVVFTLQHVDTGTTVTFYDRPGVPASTFGCSGDNVDATLDDEAGTLVENECGAGVPAIDGTFIPNNLLAAFDGEDRAGTWRITASDLASGDTGTLNTWCVAASTVGNAGVNVSGETEAVGVVGQTITYTLQITNTGDISDTFDLTLSSSDWATTLSATTVGPLAPGAGTSVEVYVTIGEGSSDMVDVTVTSQFDPLVFATVTYTTSTYLVYLPVILKP